VLQGIFDWAGGVVDGVEGLRNRSAAAERTRRRAEWDTFMQGRQEAWEADNARQRAELEQAEQRFPAQAAQVLSINNQAANAEVGRTQQLEGSRADTAMGMMTHAANVQGGLDTTRTSNDIRRFGPIKELTEAQREGDLKMAGLFVGNDPNRPLIDRVNNTALTMSQDRNQLIRELAQMNQPTAMDRVLNMGLLAALTFIK
jgi:hypothetical protein